MEQLHLCDSVLRASLAKSGYTREGEDDGLVGDEIKAESRQKWNSREQQVLYSSDKRNLDTVKKANNQS
jgi:hypothetical protein